MSGRGLQAPFVDLGIRPHWVRSAIILLATAMLLVLEATLAARGKLRLDLAALVVTYLALERPLLSGLLLSIPAAYLGDVFSGESRGLYTAAAIPAFLIVRLVALRVVRVRLWSILALATACTAFCLMFRLLIEASLGPNVSSFSGAAPAIPGLLLGALLGTFPVFGLLRWIDRRFEPKEDIEFRSSIRRR